MGRTSRVPSRVEHGHGANCVIVQQGIFQRHTHRISSGVEAKMTGGHHQPVRQQQNQRFCHDDVALVTRLVMYEEIRVGLQNS